MKQRMFTGKALKIATRAASITAPRFGVAYFVTHGDSHGR